MTEAQKDTQRIIQASRALLDARRPDDPAVMVTLEGLIALVLLVSVNGDECKAAAMLNEALVAGVEERLALHAGRDPE